jgi:hypothetical protein
MNNKLIAILVWFACEIVLQIHGIRFWHEHGGWQGWLWSVVLCVVTVWFWLHHKRVIRLVFGVLASVLLLAGPLWQVGAPLSVAIDAREVQQQSSVLQLEMLQRSEAELSATLDVYLRNSESRSGWAPIIDKARADLLLIRQQIAATVSAAPGERSTFLSIAVIIIQLSSLIVLQVAAVASLLVIRSTIPAGHRKKRTVPNKPSMVSTPSRAAKIPFDVAVALIKKKVIASEYGSQPSMRKVMAGEGVRHPETSKAFSDLLSAGILVKSGQKYNLVQP